MILSQSIRDPNMNWQRLCNCLVMFLSKACTVLQDRARKVAFPNNGGQILGDIAGLREWFVAFRNQIERDVKIINTFLVRRDC